MPENGPSPNTSPQGRRVLVAVVTGEAGDRIQAWRMEHDRAQGTRIPPHTTLCYWATDVDPRALSRQVHHAFPRRLSVPLGRVSQFPTGERSMYVEILNGSGLDMARTALYDATFVDLGPKGDWPWHITCVRDARGRDVPALIAAAQSLPAAWTWTVDTIACLELQGERYEPVATWSLPE